MGGRETLEKKRMPKRKLSIQDKAVIRETIKKRLAAGDEVIAIVTDLSGKYKVVPETIRWYIKGIREGRPVRKPGRPPKSKSAPKAAKGRKPARKSETGGVFLLDAQAAEVVLRHGASEHVVARVVYQDEGRLVSTLLKALSGLQS